MNKKYLEVIGEVRKNNHGTEMKIIAYRNSNDIDVEFLDEHQFIRYHSTYANFRNGRILNPYDKSIFGIGYLGEGAAKQKTQAGYCWRDMMERCYSKKQKHLHPSYYGKTTVCEEWHNFQNFAKWYNDNFYQVGTQRMHLDKDILVNDNKEYSPNTCLIVPQRINMLFLKKPNKNGLPNGVKMDGKKYDATYNGKHLGTFNSIIEAKMAHEEAKRKQIKNVAEEYKQYIPERVYNALLNW